ncbi:uncharacterized protein LOC132269052 isoform X3 [Cornus florida]|uniref:uncharacterized protein LOC132269052 isoform X3 n=1 Tax=Cornus florida TaxID=4283 RepID=UPI0028971E24|nr:uncharacterized protein LOC132269052 isoform X3 [Cornus florida]
MDQTSGSSTGKKRAREEDIVTKSEDIDQTPSLEENFTFSDTLVALRIMRAQFPRIDKVSVQPFILQSQLYSSVKDRTQVDRELESLRRERVLRIFKLNTGQDDHAIMFLDDYLVQIDRIVKRMEAKKQVDLAVFEWFRTHVIHSKLDPSIGHQELTRQLIDPNMYWFAIPNIGSVLKGLSQKGTPFLSKPKEIQRDDVGCFREEASPIFSVGYEISHSRSGWFRSPRNCPDTQWLSYPGLKGLKTQEIHKLQPIAI